MSFSRIKSYAKGFFPQYSWEYIEIRRQAILKTREKRYVYRSILNEHLKSKYGHGLLSREELSQMKRVVFLLSGSRGGSSIAADILKQQARGSDSSGKKIFCLPGEQRPYFELSKLTPPFTDSLSNRLDLHDARDRVKTTTLLTELSSDIGYPENNTADLLGFAITIYGRLLLQWPNIDFASTENAIAKIHEAIKTVSPHLEGEYVYIDTYKSKKRLMLAIKEKFPQIDLAFYDMINNGNDLSVTSQAWSYDHFIEEPPFIIPSPWHFATGAELSQGILLMKDSSDAWRIPFWQELFQKTSLSWLHLTRNAPESINGLCDGWKFPYGYLTTRSPNTLKINNYTNSRQLWTQWYVNYSTSDRIWEVLLSGEMVDLEYIAALQWADAHRTILDTVGNEPDYYRLASDQDPSRFGFEWLRSKPLEAVTLICQKLDLQLTPSLIDAAERIKERMVQVTPGTEAKSERWMAAKNSDLILAYAQGPELIELSQKLGYHLR
jgi:hypothetical protein